LIFDCFGDFEIFQILGDFEIFEIFEIFGENSHFGSSTAYK